MDKYSKMWWSYLIGQSFFAPAFLFMFMLATKFINSKLIESLLKITEKRQFKNSHRFEYGRNSVNIF